MFDARGLVASMPTESGRARVLDGASLSVAAGELVDVVGPSGCGKSTLLRALARLLPGATGELSLDGVRADQMTPAAWRLQVALVPQVPALLYGDVASNLLLPWTLRARHAGERPANAGLREALDAVGLADIALDRDSSRLSVGQAARVALARVALTSPRVLLLDEPDAALDDASTEAVTALTRAFVERGGAVVRVRHHRADGLANRRLRLSGGTLSLEAGDGA
ncbi:MAG: ATP-binding cassette domain-containing protein [Coriobacteriia bacterium]|nr:ATP-binding cassette domain-containing protein [Coriobacteriia bacterium]